MEKQLLLIYPNLKADVVKLGHHGSRTSSNTDFLPILKQNMGLYPAA